MLTVACAGLVLFVRVIGWAVTWTRSSRPPARRIVANAYSTTQLFGIGLRTVFLHGDRLRRRVRRGLRRGLAHWSVNGPDWHRLVVAGSVSVATNSQRSGG